MDTLKFFWKYPRIVTLFYNVYNHIEDHNYDFPFVVCGDAGTGKTMFSMHLYELWHRVILKQSITKNNIKDISGNKIDWLNNINTLKALDMNINDEAADGLSSKDSMKTFNRDIEKLYKVNRKKRLLTGLIVLDLFDLPPFYRKRIRGFFHINKRGVFKYYTAESVKWIVEHNENKKHKRIWGSYPIISGVFPDYKGTLREPYDERSQLNCDNMLKEIIDKNKAPIDYKKTRKQMVYNMIDEGKTYSYIQTKLRIGRSTISKFINEREVEI